MSGKWRTYEKGEQGVCPFCKDINADIEGQEVVIEEGSAYQKCLCHNCDNEWEDRYVLTSYYEYNYQEVSNEESV